MPFALVFIGLIMVLTGVKNTHGALGEQLVKDFTGPNNFLYWFVAIGIVGAVGAIPSFKPISRIFLALIIIVMVIRNGGIFDKLTQALAQGPVAPARPVDNSSVPQNEFDQKLNNFLDTTEPNNSSLLGTLGAGTLDMTRDFFRFMF